MGFDSPYSFGMFIGGGRLSVGLVAPPNDNFVARIPVSGAMVSVSGSSIGATKEAGEPNHYSSGGGSVWWTWTAPASGTVTIDTIGSNFDTLLGVYTGTVVNNLIQVAQDDDSGGSLKSRVTFVATTETIALLGKWLFRKFHWTGDFRFNRIRRRSGGRNLC